MADGTDEISDPALIAISNLLTALTAGFHAAGIVHTGGAVFLSMFEQMNERTISAGKELEYLQQAVANQKAVLKHLPVK